MLYSGTVAAAIEGAFYGITSFAVSLEFAAHAQFDKAARLARGSSNRSFASKMPPPRKAPAPQLFNLNIPTAALDGRRGLLRADERRRL